MAADVGAVEVVKAEVLDQVAAERCKWGSWSGRNWAPLDAAVALGLANVDEVELGAGLGHGLAGLLGSNLGVSVKPRHVQGQAR